MDLVNLLYQENLVILVTHTDNNSDTGHFGVSGDTGDFGDTGYKGSLGIL